LIANPDGLEGTASDILKALTKFAEFEDESALTERTWPKNPTRISKELGRLKPDLLAKGIEYVYERTNTARLHSLKYTKVASPASPASQVAQGEGSSGDARKSVASPIPTAASPEKNGQKSGDARTSIGDATNDARKNAASPLEPALRQGCDASDASDTENASIFTAGKTDGIDLMNDPPQIEKGDRVIPAATARWQRKGSQPLPPFLVPKGLKESPEICVGIFEGDLFFDLISTSRVLEVSPDGKRVKVMSAGGRRSIFPIEDVSLFQKSN
jgi:hypothetical protein